MNKNEESIDWEKQVAADLKLAREENKKVEELYKEVMGEDYVPTDYNTDEYRDATKEEIDSAQNVLDNRDKHDFDTRLEALKVLTTGKKKREENSL